MRNGSKTSETENFQGDSGSGIYAADRRSLVAIDNSRTTYPNVGNLVIRIDYFLSDICRVTGVCASGVKGDEKPKIKFDQMLIF